MSKDYTKKKMCLLGFILIVFLLQTHKIKAQHRVEHNPRNDMKITLSRQEIEKVLLDYANKLVEGYGFNEVVSSSYRDLPPSVELGKQEPKEEQ
jgi:hypothetical protein